MKTDNYLALCLEQAAKSSMRYRHGCIVVRGGKVIGEGFNDSRSGFDGGALKTGSIATGPPKTKCKSSSDISDEMVNDNEATKNAHHKTFIPFENMGGGHSINTPLTMHSEMMAIRSALSTSSTLAATIGSSEKPCFKLPGLSKRGKRLRREGLKAYVSRIFSEDDAAATELPAVERRRGFAQVQQEQFEAATSQPGSYGECEQERRGEVKEAAGQGRQQRRAGASLEGCEERPNIFLGCSFSSRPEKEAICQPQTFLQPHARTGHAQYTLAGRRRYTRLNGADLYVVRLGNNSKNEVKQSRRPLEEGEQDTRLKELDRSLVKSEKTPSTGSLHEELVFPDPRTPYRSPPKDRELFDCSMVRASKPCYRCVEYMRSVGIKRVFWTDETGQWKGCKVHELYHAFDKMSTDGHADGSDGISKPFPPFNCWTLTREPSQVVKDEETEVPIESFSTGFKGTYIDSLADFVTSHIPEPVGMLAPFTFAVLDKRSERNDNVLLMHQVTSYPDCDPEDTDPDPSTAKTE
ncbi:MAG: hypothetical protein Q9165_001125 [Trypethelium subeluteriae]